MKHGNSPRYGEQGENKNSVFIVSSLFELASRRPVELSGGSEEIGNSMRVGPEIPDEHHLDSFSEELTEIFRVGCIAISAHSDILMREAGAKK